MITIKQASIYINFAADEFYEPYDHTLISCDCGRLCERGVGLCDVCIDEMTKVMAQDLEKLCHEVGEH